jgi:hopanoid-associated phosphorylase
VVVALAAEAGALVPRRVRLGSIEPCRPGASLYVCGMGPEAAAAAAQILADKGVRALAVFGVAGALDPRLSPGDLLCPQEVLAEDGRRYTVDSSWRARLGASLRDLDLRGGSLLTVREPLLTPESKDQARLRFGACAVDMESAAVAEVAAARGLPLLVLRAISDGAGDAIPLPLANAIDRWGRPRPGAVALALLLRPQLLLRLPRLAGTMQRATTALRRAASAAGADLAYHSTESPQR